MSAIEDIRRELARWNCPNRYLKIRLGQSAGRALLAGMSVEAEGRLDYRWPKAMPLRFLEAMIEVTDEFQGWEVAKR